MDHDMNKSVRYWIILAVLIVVAALAALWASSIAFKPSSLGFPTYPFEPLRPPSRVIAYDFAFFYTVETVVSTVNVALSIILLATYVSLYGKTRSEFTVGLIIFSGVILLDALVSDPLMVWAFGFRGFGLGPFAMLPDLFTLAALVVLLFLSVEY